MRVLFTVILIYPIVADLCKLPNGWIDPLQKCNDIKITPIHSNVSIGDVISTINNTPKGLNVNVDTFDNADILVTSALYVQLFVQIIALLIYIYVLYKSN